MPEQISSYRLEEEIARGGMGIVYRGVHTVFEEIVAIKAIYPELTLDPELRERFLNEAKIQRRLQHPNIVQIREFLIEQKKFYIVMEFIEGETLTQHLKRLGRPMLPSEAIPIFRQALEGLGFAHSQGVIHRDIKPSNIMLTRQGVAKLTDFGIARALGTARITRTGMARGTPAYMSPEQIQGAKLDHRTDIYSLGIMLYEMLTGRVPFERPRDADNDFAVLEAHIRQAPMAPSQLVPEIPAFLEVAILKALDKRPENRFVSCQGFQAALVPPVLPATVVVEAPRLERVDRRPADLSVRENPKDGLKYVWIPPGTFIMGCSPGDNECYDDEKPSHRVTISKGFWIGQTAVTVAAYKRFAAATGQPMPPAPDFNSGWANDNMPIVDVSWDDARDYCSWAGRRLLTEAEWEYAARGGSTEARYGTLDEIAWYFSNSGQRTHDVAQKRANAFGLFDMLGNVWEWVNDWYDDKYYQNSPRQDPPGAANGQYRVLRGGSCFNGPRLVRVSYRLRGNPAVRYNLIGSRCGGEVVNP
jgi:serine/threonine protein kinase